MFTEKILVSLTKVQKDNLKKYSLEYGITISQLVRSSLQLFFLESTKIKLNAKQD
jgi:hypothetical protein